jgi:hypothetical protein
MSTGEESARKWPKTLDMALLVTVTFSTACSPAPHAAGPQAGLGLEGVWEVRELEFTSSDGTRINENPLPGQAMFSSAHYSLVWMPGDTAMRQFEARWTPTNAEKVRRYSEIVVNSGRYVRQGSTLTLWPSVSRVPEFMDGGRLLYEYRRSADTLWLTSLDEYSYDGVQAPWAAADDRVTLKLVRVEDF